MCNAADPSSSDAALLDAMAHGDPGALETLYARYARPVFSLASRLSATPTDAEEITQDVFVRLWKVAGQYRAEQGTPGTWILHLTYACAMTWHRKQARYHQTVGRAVPEIVLATLTAEGPLPCSLVSDHEQTEAISQALKTLSSDQRQALLYAYGQELSHQDIATILSQPLGTITSRIRRALLQLRFVLEHPLDDPHGKGL